MCLRNTEIQLKSSSTEIKTVLVVWHRVKNVVKSINENEMENMRLFVETDEEKYTYVCLLLFCCVCVSVGQSMYVKMFMCVLNIILSKKFAVAFARVSSHRYTEGIKSGPRPKYAW